MKITPEPSGPNIRLYRGLFPSVTEVLKVLQKPHLDAWRNRIGAKAADGIMKDAAAFGTKLHAAAELISRNQDVDSDIAPYAVAVKEFYDRYVDQVISAELQLVSVTQRFGGTLDLHCLLKDGSYAVVDFKTSKALSQDHNWQTAGYAILLRENGYRCNKRLVVRVKKDKPGEWHVRDCKDHAADVAGFLACRDLWWCLNRNRVASMKRLGMPQDQKASC